jgi:N-acetylglucosamine-6-phosphate deacetylase
VSGSRGAAPAAPEGTLVAASCVITGPHELRPGWVHVVGADVAAVGEGPPPRTPDLDLPATTTVVPGFVDTHVHGGGGASFSTEDPADARRVTDAHLRHGTTTQVASLVTAPLPDLLRQVATLRELVEDGVLAGLHLEGPWLSPRFRGAHDASALRTPAPEDVAEVLGAARGSVRMVTLAPELEGGLAAVRQVVAAGAVAAVGHTGADHETACAAVDAGATVATHLFNAMPQVHHRDPGPVVALLADERVAVELILDGHHLHRGTATLALRSAPGRLHLVTDAMAATGAPDGRYHLGSRVVDVADGVATISGTQTLAGSTLTMDAAVRGAVAAGASLLTAVQAATLLPARHLGLGGVGELAPGCRADLVLLDDDLVARHVMRRGRWVDGVPA